MNIIRMIAGCNCSYLIEAGPLTISHCSWSVVSTVTPLIILLLSLPSNLYNYIRSRRYKKLEIQWTKFKASLVILTLLQFILILLTKFHQQCSGESIVTVILVGLTLVMKVTHLLLVMRSGARTSKTFFYFWLLMIGVSLVDAVFCQQNISNIERPVKFFILILSCVLFVFQWFCFDKEDSRGEESCSHASSLSFQWLDFLFVKGFSKNIEFDDIPSLPSFMKVSEIIRSFEENYKVDATQDINKLLITLLKSFGGRLLIGSGLRLVNDVLLFLCPLILRTLLKVIESEETASEDGYYWCLLLLITAATQTVVMTQYFKSMAQVGFQMRTAVMSAIFKKSLKMSPESRQQYSVGEITNLLAIDAEMFAEVMPHISVVWSAPLQIMIALACLYDIVGNSAFAGVAILFLLVPANVIGNYCGKKIQTNQMNLKDQRILKLNEILKGIKAIKYYCWEEPFMNIVTKIRKSEIRTIKQYAIVHSMLNVTFSIVPLMVTLATFSVYIFSDPENNILTAEKVFSCIAIFNILRIPLFLFPMFSMKVVKLFVSLRRISRFLNSTDVDHSYLIQTEENTNTVEINSADLGWDEKSIVLKNINFKARKGELVAVIGKVGSGKSSLLSAIIGDLNCKIGSIAVSKPLSYVSQQAWIQNLSLRDNILFGSAAESPLYENIIEACALSQDLQMFPGADQTEIGENGINLSGGQKQRVSLSRAAYKHSQVNSIS